LPVVAKERLKSPRARLFVALDLPDRVRGQLAAWQRAELGAEELRPSRPETLHMTLAFLGYKPEKQIPDIAAAATEGLAATAPRVRLLPDPVPVPRRGRPRLFAIDAESPGTVELQAEVEAKLVAARFYAPEKRDFWPHLTIARVRTERRPPGGGARKWSRRAGRPMQVSSVPGPLPKALREPFLCVRVALYRSLLRPSGAEYVPMAHVELPVAGGGKAV
jgi:RNA 2',3'-cyclic 3'-phosphodiesterase